MNRRERLLLTLFLSSVVFGGLAVGTDWFLKQRAEVASDYAELELQIAEIEVLLEEKDLWQERRAWLDAEQPDFTSGKEIENALFEEINTPAVGGVSVTDIKLQETEVTDEFATTGAIVTVTGPLNAVFLWIHGLQHPSSFRIIEDLSVTPLKENDGQVRCVFTVSRWYAL